MSTPAEQRRAAVAPFVAKYAQTCPRIHAAQNIPQLVDVVVRQRIYDSGGRISYAEALRRSLEDDRELAEAYARS